MLILNRALSNYCSLFQLHNINEEIHSLVRHPRLRSSRERSRTGTRIRTLLLERIRVAVNRIVRSCFLDPDDDEDEDDDDDNDDDFEMDESESEVVELLLKYTIF